MDNGNKPMVSLPNNAAIKKALETYELMWLIMYVKSDTLADRLFHSTGWGEKTAQQTNLSTAYQGGACCVIFKS
ncbi:hypothetical protein P4S63_26255 [Pseudoalteromonas sp. B193]